MASEEVIKKSSVNTLIDALNSGISQAQVNYNQLQSALNQTALLTIVNIQRGLTGDTSITELPPTAGMSVDDFSYYLKNNFFQIVKFNGTNWEEFGEPISTIKSQNFVSVFQFGGEPDGVTSYSQFAQDAIDHAKNNNIKNIIFPASANNYLLKDLRVYSGQKIVIQRGATLKCGGNAPTGTTTVESQTGIFHIWGTDVNDRQENIEITGGGELIGLRPSGDWSVQTSATYGDDVIQVRYADDLYIHHIKISDAGQDGIELKQCNRTRIVHVKFQDIADAGIEDRGCEGTVVAQCYFLRVRNGFYSKSNDEVADTTGALVENNEFNCHHSAILCELARNSTIRNNSITPTTTPDLLDGSAHVAIAFNAHSSAPSNIDDISGNNVYDNTIDGVTTNTAIRLVRPNAGTTNANNCYDNVISNCVRGIDWQSPGKVNGNEFDTITGTDANDFVIKVYDYTTGRSAEIRNNRGTSITPPIEISSIKCGIEHNELGSSIEVTGANCSGSTIKHNNTAKIDGGTSPDLIIHHNRGIINKIEFDGDNVTCTKNTINKSMGAGQAISADGDNAVVSYNTINVTDATCSIAAILFVAGNTGGECIDNEVTGDQAIANIRVYADGVTISHNQTTGQSQGIRVDGADCDVEKNKCTGSTFQSIELTSTSSGCTATQNRTVSNGTNAVTNGGTNNSVYTNLIAGTWVA